MGEDTVFYILALIIGGSVIVGILSLILTIFVFS